jgi:hypothetical protein
MCEITVRPPVYLKSKAKYENLTTNPEYISEENVGV